MKQIIIALLTSIVLILSYNLYKNHQRFHSPEIDYVCKQNIDKNYHNKIVLQNYYQAIEDVNNYVRSAYVNNDVDVRNPERTDIDTKAVVVEYTKKLGIVKMYENQLVQSAKIKSEGLTDNEVITFEQSGYVGKDYDEYIKKKFLLDTFNNNPDKYSLNIGDYNSFVFELQKILVKKGYNIPIDGIFKDVTLNAISQFEQQNELLADGKLDALTLNYLLRY